MLLLHVASVALLLLSGGGPASRYRPRSGSSCPASPYRHREMVRRPSGATDDAAAAVGPGTPPTNGTAGGLIRALSPQHLINKQRARLLNTLKSSGDRKRVFRAMDELLSQPLKFPGEATLELRQFTSMLAACRRLRAGEKALELMETLRESELQPNAITYAACIGAVLEGAEGGAGRRDGLAERDAAIELYQEGAAAGLLPTPKLTTSGSSYHLDLHEISGATLRVAIWASLASLLDAGGAAVATGAGGVEDGDGGSAGGVSARAPALLLVTGYRGRRAAARRCVLDVVRRLDPPLECRVAEDNPGRIVVEGAALADWLSRVEAEIRRASEVAAAVESEAAVAGEAGGSAGGDVAGSTRLLPAGLVRVGKKGPVRPKRMTLHKLRLQNRRKLKLRDQGDDGHEEYESDKGIGRNDHMRSQRRVGEGNPSLQGLLDDLRGSSDR